MMFTRTQAAAYLAALLIGLLFSVLATLAVVGLHQPQAHAAPAPRCVETDRTWADPAKYAPQPAGTHLEIVWEQCQGK